MRFMLKGMIRRRNKMVGNVKEEEYEMLSKEEKVKYGLKIIKKKHEVREILIRHRRYPLASRGWNYEELNTIVKTKKGRGQVEIYWLRQNWNGSGYTHLCEAKIDEVKDIFDIASNVKDANVKDVVEKLFGILRQKLENTECANTVLFYFPE